MYRYDSERDELVPEAGLDFPVEVYEQGRIHDLRGDVDRQLDMLDEFAGVETLKRKRAQLVWRLNSSAQMLAPLHEERERIKSQLAELPALRKELEEKTALLPGQEREKWAAAGTFVAAINVIAAELSGGVEQLVAAGMADQVGPADPLRALFGHQLPELDPGATLEADALSQWRSAVKAALEEIAAARAKIIEAVQHLEVTTKPHRDAWEAAKAVHQQAVREALKSAGVTSPQELVERVSDLQYQVSRLTKTAGPRLAEVEKTISDEEGTRRQMSTISRQILRKCYAV